MAEIEVAPIAQGLSGRVQSYDVVIDGTACGSVKSGEKRVFQVVPGIHTVRLETGRLTPPPIKIVVSGTTSLLCETRPRLRFGLFPTGAPEIQVRVCEQQEPRPVAGAWRDPAHHVPALQAITQDMLAAD